MNIIGLSAFYHESACCLLRDGELVAAAAEERFTRLKHDPDLPVSAFRFCLDKGGLDLTDIDCIAYFEQPQLKRERQTWARGEDAGLPDPRSPEWAIRDRLGFDGRILCFEHHDSHAASSFYFSGFQRAALLTVDGVGEWTTTRYGAADEGGMTTLADVRFPDSLGLFYSTMTSFLGFKVNNGEYKVMGLAPYGKPTLTKRLRQLVRSEAGPGFSLDPQFFDFVRGGSMYSSALSDLLGMTPREPESQLQQIHMDLARATQMVLEDVLLEKTAWLAAETGERNLCMAGGVALNCVANGRIRRESAFEDLFIQPAAGDDGTCVGAAALAHIELSGEPPLRKRLAHVQLGPAAPVKDVAELLAHSSVGAFDYRERESELLDAVAAHLEARRIVGWFHGPMEFGPRALGGRSILANPMDPQVRNRLNRAVKKREAFRPFAPSVLAEHAGAHFQLEHASPFMLETTQVCSALDLPGITHVDGSARPQTVDARTHPRYHALIQRFFQRTGCPMLVNTSFNVRGEPIVCTPVDALFCMADSGLDVLVLEDFLIERHQLPEYIAELIPQWRRTPRRLGRDGPAISDRLYTFV